MKKLYSLHFDRGFDPKDEYRKKRAEFITERLSKEIEAEKGFDYLTQTDDVPKAFRIGKCTETGKDVVTFGILLFWKDAKRDEQRKILATMDHTDKGWRVNKVENAQ